tara:strand:+ start:1295 stop:2572 length:1278 start_codon:yes stop_codon:yes gene_type:complete
MSESREEMLENLSTLDFNNIDNLNIGSSTGHEVLLPRYTISTGREGVEESVSQARIYLDKKDKWFRRDAKDLIPNVNPEGKSYVGFLLSSVQESRQEKVQTLPLNGDNYVATFYGESPTIYSFGGILYNTHYARWRELFTLLYKHAFRGSAIAKHRQLLHLAYDNKLVSGWMLNLSQSLSAATDTMANFQFQFLVRSEVMLGPLEDLTYNNAYFTGKSIDPGLVDELAELPESDDYLNTARMRPPPKRQRGIGRKRYGCRPGKAHILRNGRSKKTNPAKKGQSIRNGTPTASSCDVSQAILNVIRERDRNIRIARNKHEKKMKTLTDEASRKKELQTFRQKREDIKNRAREELKTSYKDIKNLGDIKDVDAKVRLAHTMAAIGISNTESESKFLDTMESKNVRSKISGALRALNRNLKKSKTAKK